MPLKVPGSTVGWLSLQCSANPESDSAVFCQPRSLTLRCSANPGIWHYTVSCPTKSLTLRCSANPGVWLCGVLPTPESDSAVFCQPGNLILRCPAQVRVWLCGVLPTAKSDCSVSWMKNKNWNRIKIKIVSESKEGSILEKKLGRQYRFALSH